MGEGSGSGTQSSGEIMALTQERLRDMVTDLKSVAKIVQDVQIALVDGKHRMDALQGGIQAGACESARLSALCTALEARIRDLERKCDAAAAYQAKMLKDDDSSWGQSGHRGGQRAASTHHRLEPKTDRTERKVDWFKIGMLIGSGIVAGIAGAKALS